jgi:hypothetical protein
MATDFSVSSKDSSIDLIDMDAMVLASKQVSPPDRGYYIDGLILSGASWDYSKNVMKEVKNLENLHHLHTVWIQMSFRREDNMKMNPILMTTANAKLQAASSIKKNWQKYKVIINRFGLTCSARFSCTNRHREI